MMKNISFGKLKEKLNKRSKNKPKQNEEKQSNGLKEEDNEEECDGSRIDVSYDRLSSHNQSSQRIDLTTTSEAANNSHRYPIEFFRSFRSRFKKNKNKDNSPSISGPVHQNLQLNGQSNKSQTSEELVPNCNQIDSKRNDVLDGMQLNDIKETEVEPQLDLHSDESMSCTSKPMANHKDVSEQLFEKSIDKNKSDETSDEKKFCLIEEMDKLFQCGWYWGPITRSEAEKKLRDQMDGTFLVRDSSDDHYLFSLSFRSYGRTLHTRIEFTNGLFTFYSNTFSEGQHSIVQLIEESMSDSQKGVFCYSRGRSSISPSFPVRLTRPVSRFAEVRSLQYLCKFVIRRSSHFRQIQSLPLPGSIKDFIENGR